MQHKGLIITLLYNYSIYDLQGIKIMPKNKESRETQIFLSGLILSMRLQDILGINSLHEKYFTLAHTCLSHFTVHKNTGKSLQKLCIPVEEGIGEKQYIGEVPKEAKPLSSAQWFFYSQERIFICCVLKNDADNLCPIWPPSLFFYLISHLSSTKCLTPLIPIHFLLFLFLFSLFPFSSPVTLLPLFLCCVPSFLSHLPKMRTLHGAWGTRPQHYCVDS